MPHFSKLLRLAETEVERALNQLPENVRAAASECAVTYETISAALADGESLGDDLLGLFEGLDRLDPPSSEPDDMPRIRLFLDNLWDYCDGDELSYRKEICITYFHELGHYLGWDEDRIEALGLG